MEVKLLGVFPNCFFNLYFKYLLYFAVLWLELRRVTLGRGAGGREVVEVSPALFRENALIVVIYG